jgi:NitT/TauT family transport system ATP-binding protein
MRTTEKASLTVETLYQARALGFVYPAKEGDAVTALTAIDFDIRKGEFLSIVGPSGCGKTSLMKLLTGLQHPTAGTLKFRDQPFDKPPPGIGMAFQDSLLLPWRSVLDNILLPVEILHRPRAAYLDKARELLATVGLTGAESRNIWELSGGMRQRVSLCRALIADPEVLLLDEPFAALDAFTREELWLVLQELQAKTGSTMVLITHQLSEAVFLSDRVIVLSRRPGTIVHEETIDLPKPRSRADAYTPEFIAFANRLRLKIDH